MMRSPPPAGAPSLVLCALRKDRMGLLTSYPAKPLSPGKRKTHPKITGMGFKEFSLRSREGFIVHNLCLRRQQLGGR